jgi:penicillin-binding protein 1C
MITRGLLMASHVLAIVLLPTAVVAAPPSFDEVRARYVPSEAALLDRDGTPLAEIRVDLTRRRLAWVSLSEVSPALEKAIVLAEDRRFYSHAGVDWRALASAAWDNLRRARPRGASTITMQLAAQIDPGLAAARGGRTFAQKVRQARAAREIEARWSKRQILEAYLNLTSFRGELQGVHAAARGLFGKHPGGLDTDEARLLAALVAAPNAAPPAVARRACASAGVARTSEECMRLERVASLALAGRTPIRARFDAAPHLAHALLEQPGARLVTTLDAALQRFARDTLVRHLLALSDRNVEDGAVLVLDNRSGDVLAYVASSGELSDAAQVDGITARRQAGSTLKPFLYELAIERRWLTAASILDDSPLHVTTPVGLYVPQNYDRDFKGAVSLRTALGSSLNVPAVRTLLLAGFEAFHERLRALGFASLTEPADFYGYSLALGGADVSLLELTNAYRALANGGTWSPVRVMPGQSGEEPPRSVMNPGAVHIVSDILADPGARALTFGFASPLETRFWAAVKTGTSKDMRDNWAIGFSERYTVGVWVGNFAGGPMWDVSGISGAAPVWNEVMSYLHRDVASHPSPPPDGVRREVVRFEPPIEPTRAELFLAGTEVNTIQLVTDARPRIAYPGDGSILALDPDIPVTRQRVALDATPVRAGLVWSMDGQRLGTADTPLLWAPFPGQHRLTLTDASGREMDVVRFEVRAGRGG